MAAQNVTRLRAAPNGWRVKFDGYRPLLMKRHGRGGCEAEGLDVAVVGADCANAEVAIATAALVTNNKRLFI